MSILKMIGKTSHESSYVKRILEYITDDTKTMQQTLVGGHAGGKSPEAMELVKKLYHKEGGRQVIHAVLAPSCDGYIDSKEYLHLAEYVAQFFPDYQSCYAVHTDTEHTHIHIVFNTVNFKTGQKFSMAPSDLNRFRQKCNVFLTKFGFQIINESANSIWDNRDYHDTVGFDYLEPDESLLPPVKQMNEIDIFADTVLPAPQDNPDYPTPTGFNRFFDRPSSVRRYPTMKDSFASIENVSLSLPSVPVCTPDPAVPSGFSCVSTSGNNLPTVQLDIGPQIDITATQGNDLTDAIPLIRTAFEDARTQQNTAVNIGYALERKAYQQGIPMNVHIDAAPHIHIDLTGSTVESVPIDTTMSDIEDK